MSLNLKNRRLFSPLDAILWVLFFTRPSVCGSCVPDFCSVYTHPSMTFEFKGIDINNYVESLNKPTIS